MATTTAKAPAPAPKQPFIGLTSDGWAKAQSIPFEPNQVRELATKKVVAYCVNNQWYVETFSKNETAITGQDISLIHRSVIVARGRLMRFYQKLAQGVQMKQAEQEKKIPASPASV